MPDDRNSKIYDLEERTFKFAQDCRFFVNNLPKTQANLSDGSQLIDSSGSVGANYIEANESFSKKDFCLRVKISRKEAKESKYWLMLVYIGDNMLLEDERQRLINEATELTKIFGAILEKSKSV
jgi:four helix bundle protein